MRRTLQRATVLIAIAAVACTSNSPGDGWQVEQPYHRELAGVGGGNVLGSILIRGDETRTATRALVLALQEQQLSLKTPDVGVDALIPAKVPWTTDVAPVRADVIAQHNGAFPQMQLRPAYYGVAYHGMHDVSEGRFRYRIAAKLYERGALSGWTAVRDDRYSGGFFVQRLVAAIQRQLKESATR